MEQALVTTLPSLADAIRAEHEAVERDAQSAVEHAVRAGELLIEAKSQVRHGQWLPWLSEHFVGNRATAAAYMRLAANVGTSLHLPASVNAGLSELAQPREQGEHDEDATDDDDHVVDAEVVDDEPADVPAPPSKKKPTKDERRQTDFFENALNSAGIGADEAVKRVMQAVQSEDDLDRIRAWLAMAEATNANTRTIRARLQRRLRDAS